MMSWLQALPGMAHVRAAQVGGPFEFRPHRHHPYVVRGPHHVWELGEQGFKRV